MERGSDKHGSRADEQLAHEVEGAIRGGHSTHAQEWKDPEPSGEDQPDVDLAPDTTLVGGVPEEMTPEDVERRSEIAAYLGKEVWPATGAQLAEVASSAHAPDRVLSALRSLDPNATFENVQQVWSALGGHVEHKRF
jgi:hypothetical protein